MYFDKYALIEKPPVKAVLAAYMDHPLGDPFMILEVKAPYKQELRFTLAQTQLAFALWQIVADQALGIRPIAPLADPSPFRDAAE